MADINWRTWLKTKIDALAVQTGVPAGQVLGAGSLDENIGTLPAIIIKTGVESPGPFPGVTTQSAVLWVHDAPGSYLRIDEIIKALKALDGQVVDSGGVACRWAGDSTELADDGFHTITRNTSFNLQGKG